MIRRPPRSTHCISSAASDVYKRQALGVTSSNEAPTLSIPLPITIEPNPPIPNVTLDDERPAVSVKIIVVETVKPLSNSPEPENVMSWLKP